MFSTFLQDTYITRYIVSLRNQKYLVQWVNAFARYLIDFSIFLFKFIHKITCCLGWRLFHIYENLAYIFDVLSQIVLG